MTRAQPRGLKRRSREGIAVEVRLRLSSRAELDNWQRARGGVHVHRYYGAISECGLSIFTGNRKLEHLWSMVESGRKPRYEFCLGCVKAWLDDDSAASR